VIPMGRPATTRRRMQTVPLSALVHLYTYGGGLVRNSISPPPQGFTGTEGRGSEALPPNRRGVVGGTPTLLELLMKENEIFFAARSAAEKIILDPKIEMKNNFSKETSCNVLQLIDPVSDQIFH